ncbi:cytochrome P450 [Zychaea mexicana]|uniref:cytochrome P450 n=1 Tax=Zychaea mexicana TaxID=64656 RepID=UPI0022FDB35B|nr:cytochrome P450 [Zychaea mexicana]KAI9472922.1 cytochrome P450 [Zychaea mexicana]
MEVVFNAYQSYVLPLLSQSTQEQVVIFGKKHKTSISVAVAVYGLYLLYEKITKPPKNIRHLPQVPFWGYSGALIRGEPLYSIAKKFTIPAATNPYGMYVRFDNSGWCVRVNQPELVKEVFMNTKLFPKDDLVSELDGTVFGRFVVGAPNLIFAGSHQHWLNQRKVANPAFKRAAPVETFGRLAQDLFSVMDQVADKPIDCHDLMERFTLDAIGKAGFDFDFKAVLDRDNDWVQRYNNIVHAMFQPLHLLIPALDRNFLFLMPERKRAHKELTKLLDMLRGLVIQRRQNLQEKKASDTVENEKDVLTLMIEAENEGNGAMSDEELMSNLCIFFIAGHETSANSLSTAAYYMATHPEVQEKAREEANRILGNERKDILPTLDQCRKMEYINYIIEETLRMAPPVVTVVARKVTQDTQLGNAFIPKGTRLAVDLYEMQNNPAIWDEPDVFRPERFAPGNEADNQPKSGFAYVPFISGPRQCIGMNFALDEQRVLLAMMVRKYEWSLPKDSIHKERLQASGLIVNSPKDFYLNFKKLY